VTRRVVASTSPRHGFKFDKVPTIKGSMYGGGDVYPNGCMATSVDVDYGAVLDSVYEMADAIHTSNGGTTAQAIEQVLRDEGWRILPTHKQMLINRLEQE